MSTMDPDGGGARDRRHEHASDKTRMGAALEGFRALCEWGTSEGVAVRGVSFTPPQQLGGEWRAVMRVRHEGSDLVAFWYSETLTGLLEKLVKEARNGEARWKPDEFATNRS